MTTVCFPDNIDIMILRDILEIGYFGAGIVLALAALAGLSQIWLSKKDIANREKRASLEKAMEYAGRYETLFIPPYDKFNGECIKEGLYLPGYEELIDFKATKIDPQLTTKRMANNWHWHTAFNILENIAAAFILKVADSDAGYSIFGPSFCQAVYQGHDIIIQNRKIEDLSNTMEMTIKLYKEWAPKYQQECFSKNKIGENEMS